MIASGKGAISHLFHKNVEACFSERPMRSLSLIYTQGVEPVPEKKGVRINIVPNVAEFFTMPGLTLNGPCEMMLLEAIPNGEADFINTVNTPEDQLEATLKFLKRYLPWEAERCEHINLSDKNAFLKGRVTPIVRYPVLNLAENINALAMGDVAVLNDPISGQGANNASKCAQIYLESILKNEGREFDVKWMQSTFEQFWRYAKHTVTWTKILLNPPSPQVLKLLQTAQENQTLANRLAEGFDELEKFIPYIENEEKVKVFIKESERTATSKVKHTKTEEPNMSLEYLLKENEKFLRTFSESNQLMSLIKNNDMSNKLVRKKLLACIQTFSNYFQKTVLLRAVLNNDDKYQSVINEHTKEEFQHNLLLMKDRNNEPPFWDPILESTSCWFTWQMLNSNNAEKTLLMHLVLESSAHAFFEEADKVMKQYGDTHYFEIHNRLDEHHEEMGLSLLKGLEKETYLKLMDTQQKGWNMLYTTCNRIAYLVFEENYNLAIESIIERNAEIREKQTIFN